MADPQSTEPGAQASAARTRSIAETPELARLAAELLQTPTLLAGMSEAELRVVISYLRLATFAAGATVFRQGDASSTGYLLLILSGDVRVEASSSAGAPSVDMSVLGAGTVIGEMGLIDGLPRSTTCIAVSAVQAAGLARKGYDLMLAEHPAVAAKLMIALAKRLADRIRALDDQLALYASFGSGPS